MINTYKNSKHDTADSGPPLIPTKTNKQVTENPQSLSMLLYTPVGSHVNFSVSFPKEGSILNQSAKILLLNKF